ncbi:hypothetical protein AB0G05_38285 [Nonomuraea wenchangensis]
MTTIDEQAAVLALTKATHDKPWFHTTRVIAAAGSALGVLDGTLTGRDGDLPVFSLVHSDPASVRVPQLEA